MPSTFQGLMNKIFQDNLRKSILVFFEDILFHHLSLKIHLQYIKTALKILDANQPFLKQSKCQFELQEVNTWDI